MKQLFLLLSDIFVFLKAELEINSLRNDTSVSNRDVGNKTSYKLCLTFILHIIFSEFIVERILCFRKESTSTPCPSAAPPTFKITVFLK